MEYKKWIYDNNDNSNYTRTNITSMQQIHLQSEEEWLSAKALQKFEIIVLYLCIICYC